MLAYLSKKCNHIRVIRPVKSQKTRAAAHSAPLKRDTAQTARGFSPTVRRSACIPTRACRRRAAPSTLMTAGSASAARTAAPSPCATATASDSASTKPRAAAMPGQPERRRTEQRRRRRQHEPQHRAEHALSGLSGQLAQQRGQLERAVSLRRMQAGQAACRRAAQKHRAQEHKRRRAREGIKKTGEYAFCSYVSPFRKP